MNDMRLYKLYRSVSVARKCIVALLVILYGVGVGHASAEGTQQPQYEWALGAAILLFLLGLAAQWLIGMTIRSNIWQRGTERYHGVDAGDWSLQGPKEQPSLGPVITQGAIGYDFVRTVRFDELGAVLCEARVTYDVGGRTQAESSRFALDYLVLSVAVDGTLPHIFIDGSSQNRFMNMQDDLWSLHKKLDKRTRILDLEGDFYRYFTVYSASRKALDALTILTPDVMIRLRDAGYRFDYELYGNHVYVIASSALMRDSDFDAFMQAAQSCVQELVPQIVGHSFTDVAARLPVRVVALRGWAVLHQVRMGALKTAAVMAYMFIGLLIGQFLASR